jgi:hypothetical protein
MKILTNLTCSLFVCAVLFLSACSKDKKTNPGPTKNTSILGSWFIKSGESAERHLNFGNMGTFELIDVDYKGGNVTAVYYSGKYTLKGDSLNISISEKAVRKGNELISKEPSDAEFYTKSIYIVDGHSLILNYKDSESKPVKVTFSMILPD